MTQPLNRPWCRAALALLFSLAAAGVAVAGTPLIDLQVTGRDGEMAGRVLDMLSADLGIFGFAVAGADDTAETLGTLRIKITSTMKKTDWRGEDRARLKIRRLALRGTLRCHDRRVRLEEEDVARCFLTEQDSMAGGLFQRTQRSAAGVWVETDTSLIMRLIRRAEIDIFSALATEQSVRALLALYWQFPDVLGPRVLDAVRQNRKTVIPVLEALYLQAEGSERSAAAAILSRYSD